MIAKTFVTAFMAASFMAGSHASPCKVSSRTTDISTTVEILSAATSTEASGTIDATALTTEVSSAEDTILTISESDASSATSSSEGVATITAVSTTDLSTTIVEISTQTSTVVEDATTTAVSTTEISSTILESSTETSAISEDATTTAEGTTTTAEGTTTAEITTTAESTTTTAEAPPAPTFVANAGFDDEPDTTAPWALHSNYATYSLSSTIKYEGRNSAQLTYTDAKTTYIRQPLGKTPEAGVAYPISAWVRPGIGCSAAYVFCTYQVSVVSRFPSSPVITATDQWMKLSQTCTYTQEQINAGGLHLLVGFNCPKDATSYIDSVTFGQ